MQVITSGPLLSSEIDFFCLQILTIDHVWDICLFKPPDSKDEERDPGPVDQGPPEAGVPRL